MPAQLFYSKPAKIMMYLAIPVVLVTQFYNFNTLSILTQFLVYLTIAYNAECLVEGGCDLWAWLSVALPILYSILYIFFGNRLNLSATPPSPLTSLMPIHRVTSQLTQQAQPTAQNQYSVQANPNEEVVLVDKSGNVLARSPPQINGANSHVTGEPASGSGQPAPTTGAVKEAFSF